MPDIPIYAQIKRELKNQIESGELEEGARVPSEFELARAYGVSRNPTRQALRDLELEGYITRTPGRGSFVAPKSGRQKLFKLGNWRTLAVACPHLECHYTRSVIQGFIQAAAEKEFHTMVYFLRFSDEAELEFLSDIRNSGIEGIAVWLQHASERTLQLLTKFKRASFPFVMQPKTASAATGARCSKRNSRSTRSWSAYFPPPASHRTPWSRDSWPAETVRPRSSA
ncbi:MAG: GntR family transcriptional regulator [Candidatus Hydrogenedentes bacterium]|nr:GntR family transcriptional regulator [Candidatus Hydrogenedentota bacterium]